MAENKKGCMRRGLEGEEEPLVQVGRGFIVIMEKSIQGIWKRPVLICECEQHSGVGVCIFSTQATYLKESSTGRISSRRSEVAAKSGLLKRQGI